MNKSDISRIEDKVVELSRELTTLQNNLGEIYKMILAVQLKDETPATPPSLPEKREWVDGTQCITFGKFRGKKFDELPAPYLDSLRDQDWVEEKHPKLWAYMQESSDAIDEELDEKPDWTEKETPF